MTQREEFLRIANTWIGVPWARVGTERDRGVNCLGLLVGIAKECGFLERLKGEETGANYVAPPVQGEFLRRAQACLDTIHMKDALPGDLILYRIGREPQHLTIIMDLNPLQVLHSHRPAKKCVITPPLPGWYPSLVFRIRELDE